MSSSINHAFFDGIGNSGSRSTALPNQNLLERQKSNPKWIKANLDTLESIGEVQLMKNIEFMDYYKMIRGEMVYSDYGLPDLTKEIVRLRDEIDFPVHAMHFDFLGLIVNQIKGEYTSKKDRYKVDTTDPTSQNEFVRARTEALHEYMQKLFNLELETKLVKKGIDLNGAEKLDTEEKRNEYLQYLEQEKAKIISPDLIEKNLSKNWKTNAAEWAEKTLEYDYDRFNMDLLNAEEIEDYLLTGRWFRHYAVGYDYYKPERWHPCTVFLSEDLHTKYPQNGEYVGRIDWLSPSDVVNKWEYKIHEQVQKRLLGYYNKSNDYAGSMKNSSLNTVVRNNFGEIHQTPFEGYYDYDLTLQLQDVFDTPFGETVINENGEQKKVPAWFTPLNNGAGYFTNRFAAQLRTDLDIRNDLLQITEAYWRSWKRISLLNYVNQDGYNDTVFLTDDLLSDFLKDNDIKNVSSKPLEEMVKNPEINTICHTWIPEVRWGVKVKAGNSYLLEDLYIGGDALEYQIKGGSDAYDVQLPVAGYVGDSTAKKIRPYIIKHNIVMNQIYSLLEKELGTFFLFDVHYLPSEYRDNMNTRESLEQMYEMIEDLGIVPIDTSKQNLQGNQASMNAFMTQSLDYTAQISNRINLATQFKIQALEQIGITPQRTGQPSEYSTAEGIRQGMTATYAQTEPIFSVMAASSKEANLLHLTVAQYCQKEYKDYSFVYSKSDGEKAFIELSDPEFQVREWGLVSTTNPKDRKDLETLKQILLQNNTQGSDLLDFAEIVKSDNFTSLISIGRRNRIEKQKEVEAQRQHEQSLVDKELQAQAQKDATDKAHEIRLKEMDNETRIESEQIQAYGRASDKGVTDMKVYDRIDKATQQAISNNIKQNELNIKNKEYDLRENESQARINENALKLRLQLEELQFKKQKMAADTAISIRNKN